MAAGSRSDHPKSGSEAAVPLHGATEADDLATRIIRVILHIAVVAPPLVMTRLDFLGLGWGPTNVQLTADAFDLPKAAILWALAVVGVTVWAWRTLNGPSTLFHTRIFWPVLALLGWIVLATALSVHPPTSFLGKYARFEGLVSFFSYAALFFLAVQVLRTAGRRRALARSAVLAGAFVAFYAILQYLGLDPIHWGQPTPFESGRAFSTMGNPEFLGTYLVLPLLVAPALALTEDRTGWRVAYGLCFFLLTAGWVVAFTRGAWIGGIVGLALLTFAVVRGRVRLLTGDLVSLAVAAAVVAVLVVRSLGSSSEVTNVATRFRSILNTGTGSALTRREIWKSALEMVRDRPLVGHGPDTFRLVYRQYETVAYSRAAGFLSIPDNAHDYPLQLAASIGIPGFLLFAAVFVSGLASSARTVFARPSEGAGTSFDQGAGQGERLVLAGFWCAIVAYLASLLFSLSVVGSTPLLWVFLGALLAPFARGLGLTPPRGREVLAVVVLVVGALGILADARFVTADAMIVRSKLQPSPTLQLHEAQRAANLNPWISVYRDGVAELKFQEFLTAREAYLSSGNNPALLPAASQAFESARTSLEAARAYTPTEMDHYNNLATLYTYATFLDSANLDRVIDTARQGLLVAPTSPELRVIAASAYATKGDFGSAEPLARQATELDPTIPDWFVLLGQILVGLNDPAEARAALEKALALDPSNAKASQVLQSLETTPAG